jgi:hypothetical protein
MVKEHTTVALFSDVESAASAVDELCMKGFSIDEVSVVAEDNEQLRELAEHTETDAGEKAAKGAGAGAGTGAVVGGVAGLIAGVTAITIPGLGPLIAAGPLAATLGGAAAGAAVGGIIGALTGMGMSEDEARDYEERIKEGDLLIAVQTTDATEERAETILGQHGGERVSTVHDVDIRARSDERSGAYA